MKIKTSILLTALTAFCVTNAGASISTFDTLNLSANSYYLPEAGMYYWTDGSATMTMNSGGTYWDGITYSNVDDITTPGTANQYAVYGTESGTDYSGTGIYAVGYYSSYSPHTTITFDSAQTVNSLQVNNITYTALSMLNGDDYAKQFGGDSGDDEDWLLLSIQGYDSDAQSLGVVNVYLADYRFEDNSEDFILSEWSEVDLTSLGDEVMSLEFSLSSSDNGDWGMNTPAYFALDQIDAVPEPNTIALLLFSAAGVYGHRRRQARK